MADYTILSVDDDLSARMLFEIMLKRSGFDVVQAEDADDALERLTELTPDLIMTDIQLPGMNGIELVKIMRERDELQNTAIVVLSAYQSDTMVEDALAAGADKFMRKPLTMDQLSDRLIELIKNRQGE